MWKEGYENEQAKNMEAKREETQGTKTEEKRREEVGAGRERMQEGGKPGDVV